MRLIEVSTDPVRAVAVSPDGRCVATVSGGLVAIFDWDGRYVWGWHVRHVSQLAFSPDSQWLAVGGSRLVVWPVGSQTHTTMPPGPRYSGGVGFTPDGKHLYASRLPLYGDGERMDRWSVPQWKPADGFDWWPPYPRLAFSPDGQFVGAVRHDQFELRFAVSGGPSMRMTMKDDPDSAFLAFAPDSTRAVVGWDGELHFLDVLSGKKLHHILSPDAPFRDAAYTGSGRHLITVDEAGIVKLWNPVTRTVDTAYNWGVGPLTCVACTADGLAAACGTASGRVVLFDVDE